MIPLSMLFKYFMTDRSQNTCEHHSVIRLIGLRLKLVAAGILRLCFQEWCQLRSSTYLDTFTTILQNQIIITYAKIQDRTSNQTMAGCLKTLNFESKLHDTECLVSTSTIFRTDEIIQV